MKVVADDKIPFLRGALEPFCEVKYLPGARICSADLRDATALLTRTRTVCNAALLADTKVRFIATATIGFDHIDTAWCDAHGIVWTNAPGCNSASVAQYLSSALLNLAVRHRLVLRGMTLGVIGVGNVGSKVAKVGTALGMNVLLNDPPRAATEGQGEFVELARILREADFVTLHVPLEKNGLHPTFHLADAQFFRRMKPGAFFINSSRGSVCDNPALKQALRDGVVRGAVLDVWEKEPELDLELLELVEYGTPHIAGYSTDGKANGTGMSVNSLAKFFGLPLNRWYPADVPVPAETVIGLDPNDGSPEKLLCRAVNAAYDIGGDCKRLRASPLTFEKQRGAYPLRREFPVYTVKAVTGDELPEPLRASLRQLGFSQ